MEQVLFKSVLRAWLLLVICIFLSACSPKLNWRTVQSPEQRYTALFPAKPDKLERNIPYQGQELKQFLEAVKIEDDIYSISSIQVPANQSNLAQKIIDQLQSHLLDKARGSGGNVLIEDAFYQTAGRQRFPTKDYYIALSSSGKIQQTMRVRWILRPIESGGVWIYQASVLHTNANDTDIKTALSTEEYVNFFNEFHPE